MVKSVAPCKSPVPTLPNYQQLLSSTLHLAFHQLPVERWRGGKHRGRDQRLNVRLDQAADRVRALHPGVLRTRMCRPHGATERLVQPVPGLTKKMISKHHNNNHEAKAYSKKMISKHHN